MSFLRSQYIATDGKHHDGLYVYCQNCLSFMTLQKSRYLSGMIPSKQHTIKVNHTLLAQHYGPK